MHSRGVISQEQKNSKLPTACRDSLPIGRRCQVSLVPIEIPIGGKQVSK